MAKYYPAVFQEKQFNCVHCGVYAQQNWGTFLVRTGFNTTTLELSLRYCACAHCEAWSYWHNGKMVVPSDVPVPPAHSDLPADCKADFDEAREIVGRSPRAASALLRLVIQKLMGKLGESGKNINDDIGALVAKGLPVQVQQALDFCRVVGNNAVHPGELDLNDTPEVAHSIFNMVNYIVEDRIARPKQIAALYGGLPEKARKAIEERDKPRD